MAIKEDYISIHTGIVIDAAISAVIAGRAGLQGVYLNGTELTPDSSNKVSISLTGDYYNKTQIGNLLDSKVDKVEGKGLSTEDFTSTDKTKLSGIETGANKTIVVQATGDSTTSVMSQSAITTQLNSKADSSSLSAVATSGSYYDLSNKPTKLSDFTNDGVFITNAVDDLTNYYKKSETYTKTQVDNLVDVIPKFDIEVVNQLPTTDISDTTIYLVPSSSESSGMYKEYIYVNNNWELLGSQTFDISDYYTKAQTDSLLGDKVDKVTGKGLSTEDFTTAEQTKLANIESEANKTIVVQATGDSITNVMSQNAVTTQLNYKADSSSLSTVATSGSYSDLTNKPTKLSDFTNDGIFITNAVNDLTNYYTKSETYTKTQIDNLVSIIPKFDIEVVNQLPTTDISETTIYLVPSSSEASGMYKEYIYVNNSWELLGTQTFDITDYYTKTQTDSLLADKVDKVAGKGLSTEDFTTAEQQKLSGIESGANQTVVVQATGTSTTSVMSQDAVTTQLNTKATVSYYTATLSSSSWSASAPYTQTLSVTGILSTDKPVVDLSAPTASNLESWGLVASVQSGSGTLTFTCYDGVPTENLDLNIMVVR